MDIGKLISYADVDEKSETRNSFRETVDICACYFNRCMNLQHVWFYCNNLFLVIVRSRFIDHLIVHPGATIGHRSLLRYYRQNLKSDSRKLVNTSSVSRVLAQYKALGWTGTSGQFSTSPPGSSAFVFYSKTWSTQGGCVMCQSELSLNMNHWKLFNNLKELLFQS